MKQVRVVAGILVVGQRVLLTQRRRSAAEFPRLWECPGGKQESGETDAAALVRELDEELGCACWVGSDTAAATFSFVSGQGAAARLLTVAHYTVGLVSARALPRPLAADGIGWFDARALLALRVVPSLGAFREKLARRIAL